MDARPGPSEKRKIPLECGIADGETRTRTGDTTIFSRAVRSSNQPETPAKRGRRVRGPRRRHTRKFASFLPDSGDEWRLVSHWNWRRAARTAPDVAATPEGLIGDAGAVGDELLRIGHGITPPLSWLSTDSLRGVAEAEHRAIPEMVPSGR